MTELFHTSIRQPHERKIGIEIERLGMWPNGRALRYREGRSESGERYPGAEQILKELGKRESWPIIKNDQGHPLGFTTPLGKVSLEPGSQLEFSTIPLPDMHSLAAIVKEFDAKVEAVTKPMGLAWLGLGVNPLNRVEEIDVIPSTRYEIMTDYLGRRGKLGTSMMRLTTSVQINLDYTSEAEAIEMLRVALAVTPVSYALFANSPILHGKPSGYLSYRAEIWRDTDPDRTGFIDHAFCDDFDFDAYAEMIWNRPLMFAQTKSKSYVPANGMSLAQISEGKIPNVPANEINQFNAIRELFTEARLKPGYVEVRSVDGLRSEDRYAATAFWTGLLYSEESRRLALSLLGKLKASERAALTTEASKTALRASVAGIDLKHVATELVTASHRGLVARGLGEESFLRPLLANVEAGLSPAEKVLNKFQGEWRGEMAPLVAYSGE